NVYTDPSKVRYINHVSEHYRVAGPHLSEPSLQRTPLLFQAGSSPRGREFAAKHAEAVFVGGSSTEQYRDNVADVRRRAELLGRRGDQIKAYGMAVVIVGKTHEEAQRKAEEYRQFTRAEGYLAHAGGGGIDLAAYPREALISEIIEAENRPGRGKLEDSSRYYGKTVGESLDAVTRFDRPPFFAIGTPTEVVDTIQRWVEETDLDGFNLRQFLTPGTAEDFIELVVPELQKRGLYRTKYEDGTLRERLFGQGNARVFPEHPAAQYRGGRNLGSPTAAPIAASV
ncbi:MAG: N5,N10-methylene tetrahydromethanopterin reductase, partial [Glaciihabitans sp.]|nr:N5,N10-methylene tetrahydromethanopterin reductase [Glaciihabitans sp.]